MLASLPLIAGWKLFGVYIALYGVTPRRLLSGWFVTVLFIWYVLTLIRLYKPIQATRLAVFYATISFTLVSLLGSFIL
ncbi:Urease cluster proteind [Streptococcus thermophilus]|nr:Urease cluster proteind [Streptococcus thermophilus]